MRSRLLSLACSALLLVTGCEKTPPPFAKVDGQWRYRDTPIPGADAGSFEVVSEHYAKDRRQVFWADTHRDSREYFTVAHPQVSVVEGADPATFRLLARDIAKDAHAVYDEGKRRAIRDVASFELLDYGFARDRTAGYCWLTEIPGSDGPTFAVVDSHHAKDRHRAYYCDLDTDGGTRPAYAKIVPLADGRVASFRALEHEYAVDDRAVYFRGEVLAGADLASFTALSYTENGADARDARHRYASGKRLDP